MQNSYHLLLLLRFIVDRRTVNFSLLFTAFKGVFAENLHRRYYSGNGIRWLVYNLLSSQTVCAGTNFYLIVSIGVFDSDVSILLPVFS